MIDEKKLIEEIEKLQQHADITHNLILFYALDDIKKYVENMPKVNEWIPVEERLPKQYTYVLVTCDNGEVDYGFYYDGVWVLDIIDSETYSVIAWQSLPEPYKGSD